MPPEPCDRSFWTSSKAYSRSYGEWRGARRSAHEDAGQVDQGHWAGNFGRQGRTTGAQGADRREGRRVGGSRGALRGGPRTRTPIARGTRAGDGGSRRVPAVVTKFGVEEVAEALAPDSPRRRRGSRLRRLYRASGTRPQAP